MWLYYVTTPLTLQKGFLFDLKSFPIIPVGYKDLFSKSICVDIFYDDGKSFNSLYIEQSSQMVLKETDMILCAGM